MTTMHGAWSRGLGAGRKPIRVLCGALALLAPAVVLAQRPATGAFAPRELVAPPAASSAEPRAEASGHDVYRQACVACHGEDGKGGHGGGMPLTSAPTVDRSFEMMAGASR